MTDSSRSGEARAIAEAALVRLLDALGPDSREIVVVGGVVPQLIVPDVAHSGTIDLDVVLDVALVFDREGQSFAFLERALTTISATRSNANSWQWTIDVDGIPVRIDFLTDVADNRDREIVLPDTNELGAMNLVGPGVALTGAVEMTVAGRSARRASDAAYLVAKSAAVVSRALAKDLYDFAFVIVHAPVIAELGREAAEVATPKFDYAPARLVVEACEQFVDVRQAGPRTYASEMIRNGIEGSANDHALDAVMAVQRFRVAFEGPSI